MLLSTMHCTFNVAVNNALYIGLHINCPIFFPLSIKFHLSQQFPQQSAISNSTQNCPVGAVVIHADRQTDSMISFQ